MPSRFGQLNFGNFFLLFKQAILWILEQHRLMLYTAFDPLKDDAHKSSFSSFSGNGENFAFSGYAVSPNSNFHAFYLLPFFTMAYLVPDSLYVYLAEEEEAPLLPSLFIHLVFPEDFWPQMDVMYSLALAMSLFIYGRLIFDHQLNRKLICYIKGAYTEAHLDTVRLIKANGNVVRKDLTTKLLNFRARAKRLINSNILFIWSINQIFYMSNFLPKWEWTGRFYLMLAYIPNSINYLTFGITNYFFKTVFLLKSIF